MTDCIFCRIIKGEIPSAKIYESNDVISFLDIAPANKGHALVMPKQHYESFADVPKKITDEMIDVIKKIGAAQKKAIGSGGFNILLNDAKIAGQEIPHSHMHIIPRFANDGLKFIWPQKKYAEGELNQYLEKIKKEIK